MTSGDHQNDNDPCAFQCETCGHSHDCLSPHFHYSDGVVACRDCAPTYAEAQKGYASSDLTAQLYFAQRLKRHLAAGGNMTDKFFNAP